MAVGPEEQRSADPLPGAVILPSWTVTAVAAVPGGARPSYAMDYYDRDNEAYRAWDAVSRDRSAFLGWLSSLRAGGSVGAGGSAGGGARGPAGAPTR